LPNPFDKRQQSHLINGSTADQKYKQLYNARNDAISRIVAETQSRGGNAVICLRFDAGELSGGFAQVCAYGTAAIIEKIDGAMEPHPQLVVGGATSSQ